LTNKIRLNAKLIAGPYLNKIVLTIEDDAVGSLLETEEIQRETKLPKPVPDKLKKNKNKRLQNKK
jgi:hypothetical protein